MYYSDSNSGTSIYYTQLTMPALGKQKFPANNVDNSGLLTDIIILITIFIIKTFEILI